MAQCNVPQLLANARCFQCLTPGQWRLLTLQLLCEIKTKIKPPPVTGNFRITEQNDFRLTEQNDNRIIEQ